MNTKVENKVKILSDTLAELFGDKLNVSVNLWLWC